jgi:hypothetical protein
LNRHCHDYSAAAQYGTLNIVTEGIVPIFKIDALTDTVRNGLKEFKQDDFLLVSGPSVLGMIALGLLFTKYDAINLLVHDARSQKYVPRYLSKTLLTFDWKVGDFNE